MIDDIDQLYRQIREEQRTGDRRVKRRLHSGKFSIYYFKDRKRIMSWNRDVDLIRFGFLGFYLSLRRNFKESLYTLFTEKAFGLYSYAEKIVKEGWQWEIVSVKEYNIIVFFVDFCRKMISLGEAKNLTESGFLKAEEAFLKITYKEEYGELLLKALEKLLVVHNKATGASRKRLQSSITGLRDLITQKRLKPSLFDYILSYNMVQQRQYVEWDGLLYPYAGAVLRDKFYDCSLDIFKSLINRYRRLDIDLQNLKERLSWHDWLQKNAKIKNLDAPELLISIYDTVERSWHLDSSNFFMLFFTLMGNVINRLDRIVHGEWELMASDEKHTRARVLNDEKIEGHFEKLRNEHGTAEGYFNATSPLPFSMQDFQGASTPEFLLDNDVTKSLWSRIIGLLSMAFQIALALKELQEDSTYTESFFLKHMIVRPPELRGKSVLDLLAYYERLLLQTCNFFRSPDLLHELRKLPQLRRDLNSKAKEKRRLDTQGSIGRLLVDSQEGTIHAKQ
ncbi:MAG: hypothetical protein CMN78_02095 [Spirochaetales bacterium]|nr:hypothetical protein [Spirochaetales bacterium]